MKFLTLFAAIVAVAVAAPSISSWTLEDLSHTLNNPHVNPAIVPILEEALNSLMQALQDGHEIGSIYLPLPAEVPIFDFEPINPAPVIPIPAEIPAASSPLVQLIINVNSQQVSEVPAPVDNIAVNPIDVIAVNPIDVIAVNPV